MESKLVLMPLTEIVRHLFRIELQGTKLRPHQMNGIGRIPALGRGKGDVSHQTSRGKKNHINGNAIATTTKKPGQPSII